MNILILLVDYILRRLDALLEPYDVGLFRNISPIMKSSKTVISGSFVVNLLTTCPPSPILPFTPGDIDFYVPRSGEQILLDFLIASQYLLTSTRPYYHYDHADHRGIHHMHTLSKNNKQVHVVVVLSSNNPIHAIVNFDSTLPMNFISDTAIVCLYPDTTLSYIGIKTPHQISHPKFWSKYIDRGYSFVNQSSHANHSCLNKVRSVLDGHSLIWILDSKMPDSSLQQFDLKWILPGICCNSTPRTMFSYDI